MGTRNYSRLFPALLISLLFAGGCASTGAPDNWLSPATEAPMDPYGAWVSVEMEDSQEKYFLGGEFLAVDQDSLYILHGFGPMEDPVYAVPLALINKAKIAHFDPEMGALIGWVTIGSISTLSHGMGAAITFPLWVIMGSAMAGSHSRTPLENYPNLTWDELRVYARFPQGPPPGLRGLGLHPKPPEFQTTEPEPTSTGSLY